MATGRKTGGRTKGVPNKRTRDVQEKLDALNCDPISGMARIALEAEASGDRHLAAKMYAELAPYTSPKRRSIEVTHDDTPTETREELLAQIEVIQCQMRDEAAQSILQGLPPELREHVQSHLAKEDRNIEQERHIRRTASH